MRPRARRLLYNRLVKHRARVGSTHLLGVAVGIAGISAPSCGEQECITDPMATVRDPATGACILVSNDDGCAFCPTFGLTCVVGDPVALDFADCGSQCPAVGETACLASDGCRAAYRDGQFTACWSTAPSGPLHTGLCAGLDAHACSRHDNCTAWYVGAGSGMRFDHCEEEIPARREPI